MYESAAVEQLSFIKKAQVLGFKLADIKTVLEISAAGDHPCDRVRSMVIRQIHDVERKLEELLGLRATLRATLRRLETVPQPNAGCRCAAIEAG